MTVIGGEIKPGVTRGLAAGEGEVCKNGSHWSKTKLCAVFFEK